MVAAALRSVLAQQGCTAIEEQCDQVAPMLTTKFPRVAELMATARADVLAFRHFPLAHCHKLRSSQPARAREQGDQTPHQQLHTSGLGIFPNNGAITRLVGAVLLEKDEHWQLEGRRMFSLDSMAAIPRAAEELLAAEEQDTTTA